MRQRLHKKIQVTLRNKGMSLSELSKRSGIPYERLWNIVQLGYGYSLTELHEISRALNLKPAELVYG